MTRISKKNLISVAIDVVGLAPLAGVLGVSYQALRQWELNERVPRTDFTGETSYCYDIECATEGELDSSDILEWSRESWLRYSQQF